jgi:hypothetical protein
VDFTPPILTFSSIDAYQLLYGEYREDWISGVNTL